MWISFERPNKSAKLVNLDHITEIDIDLEQEIIGFYCQKKFFWGIEKELLPDVYEALVNFFLNSPDFKCYRIKVKVI